METGQNKQKETGQNKQKMAVLGQNHPLKEKFSKFFD